MLLSIIIPCLNEEESIEVLLEVLNKNIKELKPYIENYEIIFVDDGSSDSTSNILKKMANKDSHIHFIIFTRNFGKEAAMLAGLRYATGDYVTIMDADLQDPPELLKDMIIGLQEGYECVAARRSNRNGEKFLRSFLTRIFYKILNNFCNVEILDGVRDYRLMTRKMVDSILAMKEKCRFSKGLFAWGGYKTKYINFPYTKRKNGKTKWSLIKLIGYSLDGIICFSIVPLRIVSIIGIISFLGSLIAIVYFIICKIFVGIEIKGYALLMCSLFLMGGLQLVGVGILGQYIGKLFMECKDRPDYLILDDNYMNHNG